MNQGLQYPVVERVRPNIWAVNTWLPDVLLYRTLLYLSDNTYSYEPSQTARRPPFVTLRLPEFQTI